MTIPKKIIELAIEGGYGIQVRPYIKPLITDWSICDDEMKGRSGDYNKSIFAFIERECLEEKIILDPLFWQALGRSCGWGWECEECGAESLGRDSFHCLRCQKIVRLKATWGVTAHRFYQQVLTSGDTEKFWEEILPDNK